MKLSLSQQDTMAQVVIGRYQRAKTYREGYIVHQGISFDALIRRADSQYRREYTSQDAAQMREAFGFVPTRYLGIVQQKVNATIAWSNDLIINNMDAMFTVTPSPNPELDQESLDNIRSGVKDDLRKRMIQSGIADPQLLLDAKGKPAQRIKYFLQDQIRALHQVEQARIVSLASAQAKIAQTLMRDQMVEGYFRQAYAAYNFDRTLYGIGVMRSPDWQRRPVLQHSGTKAKLVWKTIPCFRHVRVMDFYPIADGKDFQTNTGNTELTYISKATLIGLANQDGYNTKEIEEVLAQFQHSNRNWLDSDTQTTADFWELDETIQLLIHEGFFSGDELREHGISGISSTDYVSAQVEVCGGRTIRCRLLGMPGGMERSYYAAPFSKIGDNLYDVLGMGAMLWDSEQRVNRLMHLFEHNADWASRPPILMNPSVFENPNDARNIRPGEHYKLEDRYATSGSVPDPVRPMATVSAQYHLLLTQVGMILRQADEDCGIPAFAYGAQDMGRSSLGEYSQRISNALRMIKQAALNEDMYFIEPAFRSMFRYKAVNEPDFADGQDVGCLVRGMTGLLQDDQRAQRQAAIMPTLLAAVQQDIVPEIAVKYAVRNLLEQAGFPVDALGITDPQIDRAIAVATNTPVSGLTPGGPQVPQLDGRSNVPVQNVATPTGASNFAIPAPSLGGP